MRGAQGEMGQAANGPERRLVCVLGWGGGAAGGF